MTLTEFLYARIAETEVAVANDLVGREYPDPRFTLRDCEAKRQIVQYTEAAPTCSHHDETRSVGCFQCIMGDLVQMYDHNILKRLALPYADHSDYREEWRP